jgi:phosphatidylserine/phosphatidylglycerophosphate/cardiolipin synthase-like enzyme
MNRKLTPLIVLLLLSALVWFSKQNNRGAVGTRMSPSNTDASGITVYFSPHGGCRDAVVGQINKARTSIDFQAYSFTSYEIARALVAAHDRGVNVIAVLDEKASREEYRQPDFIAEHGIPTYVDGRHPIAHNKVVVIDNSTVITGSFNFTEQAEKANAENLLVITGNQKLAAAYDANFKEHLGHSSAFTISQRSSRATE